MPISNKQKAEFHIRRYARDTWINTRDIEQMTGIAAHIIRAAINELYANGIVQKETRTEGGASRMYVKVRPDVAAQWEKHERKRAEQAPVRLGLAELEQFAADVISVVAGGATPGTALVRHATGEARRRLLDRRRGTIETAPGSPATNDPGATPQTDGAA